MSRRPNNNSININNSQGLTIGDDNVVYQYYGDPAVVPSDYAVFIRRFFDAYLGSSSQPRAFGGRDAELEELNKWLDDTQASPYHFTVGEPGHMFVR